MYHIKGQRKLKQKLKLESLNNIEYSGPRNCFDRIQTVLNQYLNH